MMPYKRVVFVDGDATARSVMAAAIMREEPIGTEVEVLARGLVVLFPEPDCKRARSRAAYPRRH